MQEQMSGAAMAMPADTNKAFKVELSPLDNIDLLSMVNYRGGEFLQVPAESSDRQMFISPF